MIAYFIFTYEIKGMKIHNRSYLRKRRKELRNNLTIAEAALWNFLKGRQLDNRKFRRQHSIGPYIVDFYCAQERLIVELDGDVHNNPIAEHYDFKRSMYLENLGYKILRFENQMVFGQLSSVLNEIKDNFESKH